jgi:glutaredoxin-related protein
MQSKQVTTVPHLLVLTEPNNMTSNYFNSHTIKFARYKIVISMANLREWCHALRSSERVYKQLGDQCRAPTASLNEISSVHLKPMRETAT